MKTKRFVALILMLCLAIALLPPVRSHAAIIVSGPCGEGVTGTLDDQGTLTISGNGDMYDGFLDPAPATYEDVKKIVIEPGVQGIGSGAFAFYQYVTEITIPDSVTRIGSSALYQCRSLKTVYYNNTFAKWKDTEAFAETFDRGYTLHCTDGVHQMCGFQTEWSLDDQGNFTVWGEGKMMDRNDVEGIHSPWDDKGALIRNAVFAEGVTNIGEGAFFVYENLQSVTIPESVTSIGDGAFYDCKSMSEIRIPESVTTIERNAFWGCSNLTTVEYTGTFNTWKKQNFHDDAFTYAFDLRCLDTTHQMCGTKASWTMDAEGAVYISGEGMVKGANWKGNAEKITSVTIAPGLTGIGNSAFENCSALVSAEIPDTVTLIDWYAFSNCSDLTSVSIPDGITNIGGGAFSGCSSLVSVEIPESVTEIGPYAFASCSSLKSIHLPDGVAVIDEDTFSGCTSLTEIHLPANLQGILVRAFEDCASLKQISLPSKVHWIGIAAFSRCSNLSEITIPESMATIGGSAFAWCDSLKSVNYEGTMTDWATIDMHDVTFDGLYKLHCTDGSYQMCGSTAQWSLDDNGHLEIFGSGAVNGFDWGGHCYDIKKVTIYEGITGISSECFSDCKNLEEIYIPQSVTRIGSYAFQFCSSLKKIALPEGLEEIQSGTFTGCTNLQTVMIPASVEQIGWYVFSGCGNLSNVYYAGSAPEWAAIEMGQYLDPLESATIKHNHVHSWQAATCTEPKTCTVCGAFSGSANGHRWDAMTCASSKACTVCGETAAKGEHSYQKGYCSVCGVKMNTRFEIATMRMQLKNELQADFAFVTADLADQTGCYAVVTQQLAGGATRTTTIPSSQWYKEGSYTAIPYTNIAAKEMTDFLTIVIYNAAGQALSYSYSSSLVEYAGRAFDLAYNKGDAEAMDMYINMLYYGAAAQVAFGYKPSYLASDGMSTAMKIYLDDVGRTTVDLADKEQATGSGATGGLNGSRAILESNIQLQLAFQPEFYNAGYTATYSYVNHLGETVKGNLPIKAITDAEGNVTRTIVTVEDLVIADCGVLVTIRFYNKSGQRVVKVFDSVENFAIRMNESTTAKEAQKVLAQEIMNFSTSAYNYFH